MKICVLGANGFVGQTLCPYLQGAHDVVVSNFRLHDRDAAREFFAQHSDFDVIVHMAGAIAGDLETVMGANVWGNVQLIDNLRNQRKRFLLILFSTGAVYGNGIKGRLSMEEDPHAPLDFYGLSKKSAEDLFRVAADLQGFDLTVLRMPSVYGPNNTKGVLAKMISSAQNTGCVKIFGDGTEERSFVDVRDVTQAVVSLTAQRWIGDMNISSDEVLTTHDIAHLIASEFGAQVEQHPGHNRLRRMVLDPTRMKDVTGLRTFRPVADYVAAQSKRPSLNG